MIFKIATWQISTVKTWSRSNYLSNEICLKCHTQLFNDELGRFWCQKWQYSDEQSNSAFVSIWTFSLSIIPSIISLMMMTCHFLKLWWRGTSSINDKHCSLSERMVKISKCHVAHIDHTKTISLTIAIEWRMCQIWNSII